MTSVCTSRLRRTASLTRACTARRCSGVRGSPWEKSKRKGLARLDYTQNAINKTLVAPFSVRPAPGAPVSVPISWDELDDPDVRPDRWTIRTISERLADVGDPLAPLIGKQQVLPDLS